MRQVGLDAALTDVQLKACADRCHFTGEAMGQLYNVYASMQLLLQCGMEYEVLPDGKYVFCAVTLGGWIDELQDLYEHAGRVLAAYMVECLAMELLAEAYGQAADFLHKETGLWVAGYTFYGDGLTLEEMAEALKEYHVKEVRCNEAYGLIPQKSAVYMARLTDVCQERNSHVCGSCSNTDCPNRHSPKENRAGTGRQDIVELLHRSRGRAASTYGMERIFGGNTCGE